MNQKPNWFYDEFSRVFSEAANVAQGVRREAEQLFRSQAERFISEMDLVKREDFDALRETAAKAREENEALMARVTALEAELAARSGTPSAPASSSTAEPAASRARSSSATPPRPRKPAKPGGGSSTSEDGAPGAV